MHEPNILKRIHLVQGDITHFKADAIVNAANTRLLGGGGVDGAIHRAAGPGLLEECRGIGGCPAGEARLTKGYRLPADYVIHTVGPIYGGRPGDADALAACYHNSMALADAKGLRHIAFPAISCGAYGYPIAEAAKIAIRSVCEGLQRHSGIARITFVLFSHADLEIYQSLLPSSDC